MAFIIMHPNSPKPPLLDPALYCPLVSKLDAIHEANVERAETIEAMGAKVPPFWLLALHAECLEQESRLRTLVRGSVA